MPSFEKLFETLNQRVSDDVSTSKTVELLALGTHAIGKKIVEEAADVLDGR
jgi:phosphoribosyl-ATP pyrophosphohydrolase